MCPYSVATALKWMLVPGDQIVDQFVKALMRLKQWRLGMKVRLQAVHDGMRQLRTFVMLALVAVQV
jgi:hypothetical protein